ncbi:hypothetical protein [Leptospira kanakyensis]|uniref:hypothetical protein n=1 Tax=Leptospira kanakyensis TaxID=2484968 RepID=UPI00223DF92E|nr:hypothetical protein [Leptospira kanakyensis]MCW7482608.1 hypothetical protein [Leptospira kanakyensis]
MVTILFFWMVTLPKSFFKKYKTEIFLIGLSLRVIFIFLPPVWEDDWARYLWEGNLIRNGESPYEIAPENSFQKSNLSELETEILSQINHPDWTTIYTPFVLFYFALFSLGFSGIFLKLSYLILETFSFLLYSKGKPFKFPLLYWIFPILIKEVYLNYHFEILILSLFWIFLNTIKYKKYTLSSFIFGLAVHIKFFSLFYFIYLIQNLPFKNWKKQWKESFFLILSFVFGFFIFYFIYYLIFPNSNDFGFNNLLRFGGSFKFNQFYEPFWKIFGVMDLRTFPLTFLLSTMLIFLFINLEKKDRFRKIKFISVKLDLYFLLGYLSLCLLPVYNPWYFLILLPILVTSKSERIFPWILVLVPQLSYLTSFRLGLEFTYFYEIPNSILLLEALISLIGLAWYFTQIFILLYKISNISNIARKGSIGYGNRN